MTAADNDLVEVRLLNLPVEVQRQAAEHHDALIREFELIRVSESSASIPARLVTLIDELQARYEGLSDAPRAVIEAAIREGAANVDVTYLVPAEVGEAMLQLNDLLEKADEYCRAGEHLVTLATPPLISGYRRWFIDEFVNQARGRAPEPWRDAAETEAMASAWPTNVEGETAAVAIRGDLDLASAPDLREHLTGLHARGVRSFALDTSEVSFIDSVGLSVILAIYRRCLEEDGRVTIVAPSKAMRRTLEVAGLADVLTVVD